MQTTAWFFLLLLALRGAPEPVLLEAPDSAFAVRLEWAQAALSSELFCQSTIDCDDVVINTLALNSLGRFDLTRPALVRVPTRTPLWVLGSYDYWTASGDHAFVREQWNFITNALFATEAHRAIHDGGILLGAVNGVIDMARVRADSAALERARSMSTAAERRAQEQPGIFSPVLGLLDDDLEDAHMTLIADTVHARWPLATGLVALALYRYHREDDAFALLQNMARRKTSTPAMYVLPLLRGLLGWEVDAPRKAAAIEPHLPAAWNTLSVRSLKAGDQQVDVEIQQGRGSYSIQLAKQTVAPLSLRVSPALPRGSRITSVLVNDADQPVQVESNAHDTHVVIETTLRRATTIEIEYEVPRRRPSGQ
jgi:hypothetical protein